MKTLPEAYRAPLIGGAVAVTAGLLLGAALKAEVAPESIAGQQLQVAGGGQKDRGAFANWYPAEAAPPPAYQTSYQPDTSGMDDIDRQIARLMNQTRVALPRPSPQPAPLPPPPTPADIPDEEPETYLPSQHGDILAPADIPRWAADQAAPPEAEIAPAAYAEDGAG